MTPNRRSRWALAAGLLAGASLACNVPGVTVTLDSGPSPSPAVPLQPTAPPSATSAPSVIEVATPETTPTSAPTHVMSPGEPPTASRFMTDRSSKALASERRSIADDFNNGILERPFSAPDMEYKGYLDLTRGEMASVTPWVYVTLFLEAPPGPADPAVYGVELDLDLDGRGDWLILAAAPPGTSWTSDGVRVFEDTNNDVGAQTPARSDPPTQPGDGYETLVFDQGFGPDPDAAWVRLSPQGADRVQIAFKHGMIAGDLEFLWGVWAMADPVPEAFDFHDHFTLEQAGSPLLESSSYPLRELALVDSTCRWGFDFNPASNLPGVCRIPPTPTPTLTPTKTRTPTPTLIIIK